jgi:pimeloyl-ACP methyl ester carboxylesterase
MREHVNKIVKSAVGVVSVVAAAAMMIGSGPAAQGNPVSTAGHGRYAEVNGLRMYYEVHGKDRRKPPLVLLHGGFSATGTSWGQLIRPLARTRTVISIEQQGHGHTADIVDRPLRIPQLAQDTVDLLDQIGVRQADFYGYSLGAGIALEIGINHPEKVRKLVLQSLAINNDGFHPGHTEGMAGLEPWMLEGSEFHKEYLELNPNPENFDLLVAKTKDMLLTLPPFPPAAVSAMTSPVLTVIGDSDIVRPEHAVELFRLTGGGINGDIVGGPPNSQLAILPGTTHITSVYQKELLTSLVPAFLDAPVN